MHDKFGKVDKTSYTNKEIKKYPGKLSAQIAYNELVKNNYIVSFIGHIRGNALYYVQVSKGHLATTVFTDHNIAESFVNRDNVKDKLIKSFGNRIAIVNTSLFHMFNMINEYNSKFLSNVIINPNSSDLFFTLPLRSFYNMHKKGFIDYDPNIHDTMDAIPLVYDTNSKLYVYDEETDQIDGVM